MVAGGLNPRLLTLHSRAYNVTSILVSTKFDSYLNAINQKDKERTLRAIEWFESSPQERSSRFRLVACSRRRRLHWLRVTDRLKAICAVINQGRLWLWVGDNRDFEAAARRLDLYPGIEENEEKDLVGHVSPETERKVMDLKPKAKKQETPMTHSNGTTEDAFAPAHEVKPPKDIVDEFVEAVDGLSMYVTDAKEAVSKLKKRHSEFLTRSAMHEKLVADLNATKVERDKLADDLKASKKREDALGAELASARSKVATKPVAPPAMPAPGVVNEIKDKCAKLCEEFANKLASVGRPRDEGEIEDLRLLAKQMRGIK